MMRNVLLACLLVLSAETAKAATPPDLSGFSYEPKPGSQLPLQAVFHDEGGNAIRLRDVVSGRPLILALVYFRCPNLCGVVRDDLLYALQQSGLIAGKDYELAAVSIDPTETRADARAAKADDLARYPVAGASAALHFLTGTSDTIEQLTKAVGFRYELDPAYKQFIHPAGIVLATSSGVVSNYLLGVGYSPANVTRGVAAAARGNTPATAIPVLLLCFHFDASTGRYTLAVMKVLRVGAALTVLVIGGTVFLALRRDRGAA